jgi:actin-like ATPase involved in cell morphogenesis
LQKHGVRAPDGQQPSASSLIEDMIREPLGQLVDEIRRTFSYWQGLLRGKLPEAVYLFGGGGAIRGLDGYLRDSLKLAVEPWTLPYENAAEDEMPPACLLGAAAGVSAAAWEAL